MQPLLHEAGVDSSSPVYQQWQTVIEADDKIFNRLKTALDQAGIAYLDADALLSQSWQSSGKPAYYLFADGHLNARGHAALAKAVQTKIGCQP